MKKKTGTENGRILFRDSREEEKKMCLMLTCFCFSFRSSFLSLIFISPERRSILLFHFFFFVSHLHSIPRPETLVGKSEMEFTFCSLFALRNYYLAQPICVRARDFRHIRTEYFSENKNNKKCFIGCSIWHASVRTTFTEHQIRMWTVLVATTTAMPMMMTMATATENVLLLSYL